MNVWQILITALFVGFSFLFLYVIGAASLDYLELKTTFPKALITGFCLTFAVGEILSLPFMLTHGDFLYLYILFLSVAVFSFLTACFYLYRIGKLPSLIKSFLSIRLTPIQLVSAFIVIITTTAIVCFSRFDGDDAFYLAISTSINTTGRVFANNVSIGLDGLEFPRNYSFTAFEVILTIFARLIRQNPSIFYHTTLPLILIPLYYAAVAMFGETLYTDKKKRNLFFFFVCLLTLFSGYSNFQSANFMLVKTWMGKSSTINMCWIFLLANYIEILKYSRRGPHFFLITVALLSGAATSAMGLYLLPVGYFCLYMATILLMLYKKESIQKLFSFSVEVLISVIPSLLLLFFFYLNIRGSITYQQLSVFPLNRSWSDDLLNMFGSNIGLAIFILIGGSYFLFFGNTSTRIIYALSPLCLFLTFLNPLFRDFIGHNLTSLPVYWRFFWLIPYTGIMSSFTLEMFDLFKKTKLIWLTLIPICIMVYPGYLILNDTMYYSSENSTKLPDNVIEAVQTIFEHTNTSDPNELYLLAEPNYNIYVRQFTGNIAMAMPRLNYVQEAFGQAKEEDRFFKIRDLFEFDEDDIIVGLKENLDVNSLNDLGISLVIDDRNHPELNEEFIELILPNKDYLYMKNTVFREK